MREPVILISKQRGVTLLTALLLLVIMTLVGVSATKVSSISVLIAGNDQRKMMVFQRTNSEVTNFASTTNLEKTFTNTGFSGNISDDANKYKFDQTSEGGVRIDREITNLSFNYPCKRNGMASDVGADAPGCDLYNFQVQVSEEASSANDSRHQGSGKMVPNKEHKSDITKGEYNLVN